MYLIRIYCKFQALDIYLCERELFLNLIFEKNIFNVTFENLGFV